MVEILGFKIIVNQLKYLVFSRLKCLSVVSNNGFQFETIESVIITAYH